MNICDFISYKMIFMTILINETSFSPYYDFKHLLKMKEYGLVADVLIRFLFNNTILFLDESLHLLIKT